MIKLLTELPDFKILPVRGLGDSVLALCFDKRQDMTRSMFRLQEHYESPFPEIKGQFFDLDTFDALYNSDEYMAKIDGKSYFDYWEGFNIPVHSLKNFYLEWSFKRELMLTGFESWLQTQLLANPLIQYAIAVDLESDPSTFTHEVCHACFALHKPFRIEAFDLMLELFKRAGLALTGNLLKDFDNAGYPSTDLTIICDELAAYFLTSDMKELKELFPSATEWLLEATQDDYRYQFSKIVDIEWSGVGG